MQITCFFFAAAILLGNISSLKVSGFIILLIKHKTYQASSAEPRAYLGIPFTFTRVTGNLD